MLYFFVCAVAEAPATNRAAALSRRLLGSERASATAELAFGSLNVDRIHAVWRELCAKGATHAFCISYSCKLE